MTLAISLSEALFSSRVKESFFSLCLSVGALLSKSSLLVLDSVEAGGIVPASGDPFSPLSLSKSKGTSVADSATVSPGLLLLLRSGLVVGSGLSVLDRFSSTTNSAWGVGGGIMLEVVIGVEIEFVVVVEIEVESERPVFPTDGSTFWGEIFSDPVRGAS